MNSVEFSYLRNKLISMKYFVFAFAFAGLIVACTPKTSEVAEVSETAEEGTNSTDGEMPKSDIAEGKVVFLKNCTGCHYGTGPTNVESIHDYTKEQFEVIFPQMFKNAELNPDQSRQVTAYIFWELEN